ncbi:uncharacterized protein [Amphiura filiformis]|uniref:uncharacterized protein n=1 Tax=Amphiura filiformis TaxID=82378 RepID=UPI003B2190F5
MESYTLYFHPNQTKLICQAYTTPGLAERFRTTYPIIDSLWQQFMHREAKAVQGVGAANGGASGEPIAVAHIGDVVAGDVVAGDEEGLSGEPIAVAHIGDVVAGDVVAGDEEGLSGEPIAVAHIGDVVAGDVVAGDEEGLSGGDTSCSPKIVLCKVILTKHCDVKL